DLDKLGAVLTAASKRTGRPIFLISDEAYSRILFDGADYVSPTESYPHSLLIYTYGKQLLTPGERIGYIALPPTMPIASRETLRNAITMTQVLLGWMWPNAILQYATAELEELSIDIPHLQRKRDRMVKGLHDASYTLNVPDGTLAGARKEAALRRLIRRDAQISGDDVRAIDDDEERQAAAGPCREEAVERHGEVRLLLRLADRGLLERLVRLDEATRQRPVAVARPVVEPHQKYLSVALDDRVRADLHVEEVSEAAHRAGRPIAPVDTRRHELRSVPRAERERRLPSLP